MRKLATYPVAGEEKVHDTAAGMFARVLPLRIV
jgi:hypothetical protein